MTNNLCFLSRFRQDDCDPEYENFLEKSFKDLKSDDFANLLDILRCHVCTHGVLATAIERHGVWTWDRYGRFVRAGEAVQARALDFLAADHRYLVALSAGVYELDQEERDSVISGLFQFGWLVRDLPNFDLIVGDIDTRPLPSSVRSAATKERDSLLCIIAALVDQLGLSPGDRGLAARIEGWTQHIGAVGEDTIKKYIDMIPDAIERRAKVAETRIR